MTYEYEPDPVIPDDAMPTPIGDHMHEVLDMIEAAERGEPTRAAEVEVDLDLIGAQATFEEILAGPIKTSTQKAAYEAAKDGLLKAIDAKNAQKPADK